jgi:hypothetical protein
VTAGFPRGQSCPDGVNGQVHGAGDQARNDYPDIGTGTGQFAYRFAERLAGTGRCLPPSTAASLREEKARRKIANLYPVLVKAEASMISTAGRI